MIRINIPGFKELELENIIFDYNGTLAKNGFIRDEIKDMIVELKKNLNIYVATADTYGTASSECRSLGINLKTFPKEDAAVFKKEIAESLGLEKTVCVGNGVNDILMCKECVISIAVIGPEGCSGKLISSCDIVTRSISDVFDILSNPDMMRATLRT